MSIEIDLSEESKVHLGTSEKLRKGRDLANSLLHATENAAMAAYDWSGHNNKEVADGVAVEAMRNYLNLLNINGTVVVGEGIKDKAPMLYLGEKVGTGNGPEIFIAVDPIDGTTATAGDKPGAVSVLAASEKGGILRLPDELFYVNKLIVGPQAKGKVDINAPVVQNIKALADALGKNIPDLRITVLNRPRNQSLINQIHEAGARVTLIEYGDLMPGILVAMKGAGTHAVWGVGGAPEAVITAAGLKCLGGSIQIKPWTDNEDTASILGSIGFGVDRVFNETDLVPGKSVIFSSTGITRGDVTKGITTFVGGIRMHSILLTATNGVSSIEQRDLTQVTDTNKIVYTLD